MKLLQSLFLQEKLANTSITTLHTLEMQLAWDPSKFSGIQAIIFQSWGVMDNAGYTGTIELWDKTNNVKITDLTFTDTTRQIKFSADIKASLTTATTLEFKVKTSTTGKYFEFGNVAINVEQDDETAGKKTAFYLPIRDEINQEYGQSWSNYETQLTNFHIDQFNGTAIAKLSLHGFINYGTTEARFRLWDKTANAQVADSLIIFTNTSDVYMETPALSLIAGHDYYFQVYYAEEEADVLYRNITLKIEHSGFTKTLALANLNPAGYLTGATGAQTNFPTSYVDMDKFSAGVSLETRAQMRFSITFFAPGTVTLNLHNLTDSADIANSSHTYNNPDNFTVDVEDVVILTGAHEYAEKISDAQILAGSSKGRILIFLEEALPAGPSLQADPTQPTGYHCFMSQFLRNIIQGRIPLKTPDGVNKCW